MYDPARVWRFTGDPLGLGGLLETRVTLGDSPATGQTDDMAQGPEGRFIFLVGKFKRKGMRNIYLTRS